MRLGRIVSRRKREHERSLRGIGVPVRGVRPEGPLHPRTERGGVYHGHHETVVAAAQDFERTAQRRGVGHVGIDDEETLESGRVQPVADFADEGGERLWG